jgi:hypothetical protein
VLSSPDYPRLFEAAALQSQQLNAPLHLALILSNDAEDELRTLVSNSAATKPDVGIMADLPPEGRSGLRAVGEIGPADFA